MQKFLKKIYNLLNLMVYYVIFDNKNLLNFKFNYLEILL